MLEANNPQVKKLSIQGKTRYQPSRTDRMLQLTVCKVKDAPVLLRLSGRLRRQNRLFLLQDGYGFRLRGHVRTRSCFRRDTHMRESYQQTLTGCCREGVDPEWFSRTCCSKHAKYDKRTPGLFKIEYKGDAMIGLLVCSKTYIVQKTTTIHTSSTAMSCFRLLRRAKRLPPKRLGNRPRLVRQVKFSSKGITKPRVKAPMTTFRYVLNTQRVGHGTGFRARNNGISTYEQIRNGFSNFIVNGESWTTGSRPFR